MIYVIASDLMTGNNIVKCLQSKGKEYRVVTLFFPYYRAENAISLWEINNSEIELIVMAINDYNSKNGTISLLKEYGIDCSKIFDFCKIYELSIPKAHVDRIMYGKLSQKLDGVVLGISHAEVGINTDFMKLNFANFARSHQDIFFHISTLKHAVTNYPKELNSIKYAIIDLFDYYYFNYDTSLSVNAADYVRYSGALFDAHNYDRNTRKALDYNDLVNALNQEWYSNIIEDEINTWENLFSDFHAAEHEKAFSNSLNIDIMTTCDPNNFNFGSTPYKLHENTISENINHLSTLIELLKCINPDIKIACILMPRYKGIECVEEGNDIFTHWKGMMYKIMNDFKNKYGIAFHDFKSADFLNDKMEYYFDAAHFNNLGSAKFTHYLEGMIESGKLFEI